MGKDFLSDHHVVPIHAYSSDYTAATQDAICLADYGRVTFFIMAGGTNGDTSTLTVKAYTSNAVSGGTAMAFNYRTCSAAANPATSDTWSALTAATSSGIALTATTYKCWAIEVTAEEAAAALAGADYVYLSYADGGSALTGCCFAVLSEPKNAGSVPVTAIV